ncbi:MAG: putative ABC transport system ATP-binding protein, partial [Gammaproteobacteria bacterium]
MSSIQKHADKDNVVIDYVVRVERLYKDYLLGTQRVPALKNVSLVVRPGEFLAIAGPSGSGKTTLLNIIGCLDSPTEGNIYIRDAAVSEMSEDSLARIRSQRIGFIFQTFNLMPVLTAAENVEYPLLNRAI